MARWALTLWVFTLILLPLTAPHGLRADIPLDESFLPPCTLILYIPNCVPAEVMDFPQTQRPQVGGSCDGEPLVIEGLELLDSEGDPTGILFEDDGALCDSYPAFTLETTLFPDTYSLEYRGRGEGEGAVLTFNVEQPRVETELPGGCGCDGGGGERSRGGEAVGLMVLALVLYRRGP